MAYQPDFFDVENRLQTLSEFGDPLEKLSSVVDFESFRETIEQVVNFSNTEKGGRPAWDSVLMFKVLILQTLYTISDERFNSCMSF